MKHATNDNDPDVGALTFTGSLEQGNAIITWGRGAIRWGRAGALWVSTPEGIRQALPGDIIERFADGSFCSFRQDVAQLRADARAYGTPAVLRTVGLA